MGIKTLRNEIDSIDADICKLLESRMKASGKVAEYKSENGLPIIDNSREGQIIQRITDSCDEEFSPYIKTIYKAIFDASREYQIEKSK